MPVEDSASSIKAAAQTRWLDAYRAVDVTLPRPRPNSADVPQARELVDAELAGLHLLISAMKERRNELALPSLLPPEVLALVFSFLAEAEPMGTLTDYYTGRRTLGWISVSHVCRRWRNVCLSQPTLWTHLSTDESPHWDVFLHRAKEAPLFIKGRLMPNRNEADHLQSILAHRHHIQELLLLDLRLPVLQELVDGLSGPLHHLRMLFLGCSSNNQSSFPALPTGFLSEAAPNVQHLTLFGVLFPWGEGSSTLTHFHYQHGARSMMQSAPPPRSHTCSGVAHTLQRMPVLRRLILDSALPDSAADSHTETIFLPLLEELRLTDDNDSCWYLWSQLRVPPTAQINLRSTRFSSVDSLIASTLRAHLRTSPLFPFSAMLMDVSNFETGIIRFKISDPKGTEETTTGIYASDRYKHPSITMTILSHSTADTARQLVAGVALESIHDLTWCGGSIGNSQVFYDTFLPARSVTYLRLAQGGAGHHLAALIPSSSLVNRTPPVAGNGSLSLDEHILFPELRTLACRLVNFNGQTQHEGSDISVHDAMLQALESRSNDLDLTLGRLDIARCSVLEEWVDSWKDLAGEVVWDDDKGDLAELEDEDAYYGPLGNDDAGGWDSDKYNYAMGIS